MRSPLDGYGEVFRKGGESLCQCQYELTIEMGPPMVSTTFGHRSVVEGSADVEIYGTITPQGTTADALRRHADNAGCLELLLADDRWLTIQFTSPRGNRVRGVSLRNDR